MGFRMPRARERGKMLDIALQQFLATLPATDVERVIQFGSHARGSLRSSSDDDALRWLRQAEHDLDDAHFVITGNRHGLACFLSQQSAEKGVKAFLFACGAEAVWGHSVAELCRDAAELDGTFEPIIPLGASLDKYYIPTRCPDSLPGGIPAEAFDIWDAEKAVKTTQTILSHVRKRMRDLQPNERE
ncbi:MAG: HEPN domain-containing protein [Clostridia bacterium]|nr:HEPN domain-containing protein [Clostridia bacterium]